MANNGIYYSSGNTLNFTTNNTTWATLTSGGTFVINTVSGGTYLNLPASSGGTTGDYLPLSGGTVTGATIFQSGLTANTVSATTQFIGNYLQFNTGSTNPSNVGGRFFYDNLTNDVAFYSFVDPNVKIKIGKQLYARVNNFTGSLIPKGSAIAIQSATNGIPNASLLTSSGNTNNQVIGLAANDIPNGSIGLAINQGILLGVNVSYPIGTILYLSDTVPGGYVSGTTSLQFSSRSHQIGYVTATGTTTGEIYVSIRNEDTNLTLTDIERNILEGNVISTGTYDFTGLTYTGGTSIIISPMKGWIVQNTYQYAILPDVINVIYSGTSSYPITGISSSDSTYILVNSGGTVFQQGTYPTPQQRRENIFIGKVVHPNRTTIQNVNNTVDYDVSPMSALRDLWESFNLINEGVIVTPNGANLNINTSSGILWGNGINWSSNQLSPNNVVLSGTSPTTFQYRTQTGGTFSNTTTIDTTNYDVNGIVTNIPGNGSYTTQRIYLFPTGIVRIQYGQEYYPTLAKAIAALPSEQYVAYPNNLSNGILIGLLTVKDGASDLTNINDAIFTNVSKFGEAIGGSAGLSTTTLQQAYDNSTEPEIIINSTLDGLSIKNGTGNADNVTSLLQGLNSGGTVTSFIRADGVFSGTSVFATTISATTISTTTITATTISATTYDVIGGTIENNGLQFIYTGNSIGITDTNLSGWGTSGNEIAIGNGGPLSLSTGSHNIAIGYNSLSANTTGLNNIGIGGNTLHLNQAGQGNVVIGKDAGSNVTSGSYNVVLGYQAGQGLTTQDNRLYIANNSTTTLIYGEFNNGRVGINTITPIAALDVSGNTRIDGTLSATTYYNLPQVVINNTVTVALTGSSTTNVDFNTIKDAVNSITGATSANTYTVKVAGGLYNEDPFTIPSWVSVVGESSISTVINANDSSQTLINLSDQSAIFDCQIQGCTDTGVSAVLYSSSTTPQSSAISYVENVRFGTNYTHAKVVAYGGANIIMQCSNVKYGGYPFTIGFYATNSGSGIGRMQLRNVTSTNGGIVTTTGLIFAKADAASCGFIVNGCLLTKAVGAAAGTGFYVENGGFLRLTAVNFQRWAVGIDAPQIGSAPSIDAIALNFENNTIDVNIAHSGATGKIQGTDNFLKTIINQDSPLYEVNQDPKEITVSKKGGDFTSIKSAVDYLKLSGNTSSSNRYIISVGPGEFTEGEIDLTTTPYVSIVGSNIQTTLIKPSGNTQHIISIGVNNEVSFLTLSGAPSGYAGIYCYDIGDYAQAHKVAFYDCDTNIWVEVDNQDTKFFGEYLDFNGEYTYGTKVVANNGYLAIANMENYYNFPTGTGVTYCNYATGSGATISVFLGDNVSNGVSGTTAYYIQDNAELNASTITCDGFTYGIINPNVGGSVRFDVDNASFVNGEWDLYIESVNTFGTLAGSSNHQKLFTLSSDVYWSILDINDGEFDITRKASVTFADGTHTDFTTLIFEGGSMGVISGGTLSDGGGTTVSVAAGFGYLEKSINDGTVKRIDWSTSTLSLSVNSDLYIYYNENEILSSSGTRPDSSYNILLGRVVTDASSILIIDQSPFNASHTSNRYGSLFREALGPIYAFGSITTEGSTLFTLDVTQGEYYYATNEFTPSGGTGITFTQYYRNGTGSTWITSATTLVNNTQYDNNGTLTGLTSSAYTKHTLYVVGDGVDEQFMLVLGQDEYTTLVEAENALLPTPPSYFIDSVAQVASIYIRQGDSNIIQIEDIRPTVGFRAGGVNASSVHGNLLGLTSDDHLQYLLVDGGRAMSGNLDMGGNNITSAGTINSVTIQTHADRHKFGGADAVGTTTPTANAIPYADVSGKLDSWITPVTISGGTGITTGGTYPNFTITNSAPDQTVTISGGTGITTGGTYPNFTIANSDGGSSQNIFKNIQIDNNTQFSAESNTANLNFSGINITITSAATNTLVFSAGTGGGGGVTQIVAGTNITISPTGGTGSVTINSTGGGSSLGTVYTTANNFNFL
jgi:hypothetical protein